MIIDLHTHTSPKSDDSMLSPAELIIQAKKSGLDGVCFTEHDWFWNQDSLTQLCRELDFLIIPGIEMNTEDGHIIVFGIQEFKFGMYHTGVLRDVVLEKGGFMILAHPYRHNFYSDEDVNQKVIECYQKPIFQLVDTIETLNGRAKDKQNEFSVELGKKMGWQGVGGSDAHFLKDVPSTATKFERKIRNSEELIQELKAGRYQPVEMRGK